MATIMEQIVLKYPLEQYIETLTKTKFKQEGLWQSLPECPICSHRGCAKFKDGKFYCFSCSSFASNAVGLRGVYENISWQESLNLFKQEMGIKSKEKDTDWTAIRESASQYLIQTLFTCSTKYKFKEISQTPLH